MSPDDWPSGFISTSLDSRVRDKLASNSEVEEDEEATSHDDEHVALLSAETTDPTVRPPGCNTGGQPAEGHDGHGRPLTTTYRVSFVVALLLFTFGILGIRHHQYQRPPPTTPVSYSALSALKPSSEVVGSSSDRPPVYDIIRRAKCLKAKTESKVKVLGAKRNATALMASNVGPLKTGTRKFQMAVIRALRGMNKSPCLSLTYSIKLSNLSYHITGE